MVKRSYFFETEEVTFFFQSCSPATTVTSVSSVTASSTSEFDDCNDERDEEDELDQIKVSFLRIDTSSVSKK